MSVTIKDIARYVGVSYSTVAKALNDSPLVKSDTKEKILQAAQQLGYKPNFAARSLVTKKTGLIGVVWPAVERTALTALLNEIHRELKERGLTMLLSMLVGQEAVQLFERLQVDGILLFENEQEPLAPITPPARIPLLSIGRPDRLAVPYMDLGRKQAIKLAVKQLAERSLTDIAYVGFQGASTQQADKYLGFVEGMIEARNPLAPEWIVHTDGSGWEDGYSAAKRLLQGERRPQAIISGGYDLTSGIVRALQESGVHVPDGMALIGYDNIPHMERLEVPVSAVGVPVGRIAARTVDRLLQLLAGADGTAERAAATGGPADGAGAGEGALPFGAATGDARLAQLSSADGGGLADGAASGPSGGAGAGADAGAHPFGAADGGARLAQLSSADGGGLADGTAERGPADGAAASADAGALPFGAAKGDARLAQRGAESGGLADGAASGSGTADAAAAGHAAAAAKAAASAIGASAAGASTASEGAASQQAGRGGRDAAQAVALTPEYAPRRSDARRG